MDFDELDKALAECEGHTPEPWIDDGGDILSSGGITLATVWSADNIPEYTQNRNLILRAPFIAAAVRELRETVKAKDEGIERLKAENAQLKTRVNELIEGDDELEDYPPQELNFETANPSLYDADAEELRELQELREDNAALRRKLDDASANPSLDQGLNEGDGRAKP